MEVNKYQTALTDDLIKSLTKEEYENLFDYINNVPFIQSLISPDRKYARDLPRKDGRIIVDVCHPHILEDMEYFRPAGNHYKKYGCYTKLRPNGNPNSEFGKWIRQELDRIWNGYVRPSDGEWVTGDFYFYINYCPIMVSRTKGANSKVALRVSSFPEIWEANYLWFHYIDQARHGGLYNDWIGGQHAVLIARRGVGKSYSAGALLAKIFTCGESLETSKEVTGLVTAYEKEYLTKDGILNKFVSMADFCAENTQFPSARYKNSLADMNWIMGYMDANSGIIKGTKNEIIGFSSKDNPDKGRGKRAHKLIFEEFGRFPQFLNTWNTSDYNVREGEYAFGQLLAFGTGGCVCAGTQVFTATGNLVNIEKLRIEDGILGYDLNNNKVSVESISNLRNPALKPCLKIITNSGRELSCSIDHPIYSSNKLDVNGCRTWNWYKAEELSVGDTVAVCNTVDKFGDAPIFDARLVGLLIGDGSYVSSPRITSCDREIQDYIKSRYSTSIYNTPFPTQDGRIIEEIGIKDIRNELRSLGIYGQSGNNKRIPQTLFNASKEDVCNFIAGLIDTDGCVSIGKLHGKRKLPAISVSIATSNKILAEQVQLLLSKIGVYANISTKLPSTNPNKRIKDKNLYYSIDIQTRDGVINLANSVHLLIKYKQKSLEAAREIALKKKRWRKQLFDYEKIVKIENIGLQPIYNLTASNTHTYLANGIITHNTEGSDFSGALELIYHPDGYGTYAIPNVFDKNSQGKTKTVFFLGAYMNRKGYYNSDGVSDVIGALLSEIRDRIRIKYNSSDAMALTQRKAEMAITIQEAIMKRDNTIYPVADLNDRLNEIDFNPHHFDDLWIGRLAIKDGAVVYKPDTDVDYIKNFPHKDNKLEGAICIKAMPETDSSGNIPTGRYIAGIDPYDDDVSNTMSLGALYILDLFTDELVFEYVGRPTFADDFYEICRKALLFYNAECNYENNKKGLFKYFSQHNCLYLLSDTLEFLRDKEMIRGNLYGNKNKGVNATEPIKAYARRCIRDWLLKPTETNKILENGEVEETTSLNLFKIPYRALIQELSQWNSDANFDRHDALGMLMLLREDKLRLIGEGDVKSSIEDDPNYLGNDPFFSQSKKGVKFKFSF